MNLRIKTGSFYCLLLIYSRLFQLDPMMCLWACLSVLCRLSCLFVWSLECVCVWVSLIMQLERSCVYKLRAYVGSLTSECTVSCVLSLWETAAERQMMGKVKRAEHERQIEKIKINKTQRGKLRKAGLQGCGWREEEDKSEKRRGRARRKGGYIATWARRRPLVWPLIQHSIKTSKAGTWRGQVVGERRCAFAAVRPRPTPAAAPSLVSFRLRGEKPRGGDGVIVVHS